MSETRVRIGRRPPGQDVEVIRINGSDPTFRIGIEAVEQRLSGLADDLLLAVPVREAIDVRARAGAEAIAALELRPRRVLVRLRQRGLLWPANIELIQRAPSRFRAIG